MENQKAIDAILLRKTKLVAESEFLQAQKRANGKYAPGEKERLTQLRVMLTEMNNDLIRLGYRKKMDQLENCDTLVVMLRMKDIITENFGHEKAVAFEVEARRRQVENNESKIFPLLAEEELQILEQHKKWSRDQLRYAAIQRQMDDLRGYLQNMIKVESDFDRRKIYSEIMKML